MLKRFRFSTTILEIQKLVAEYLNISVSELINKSREKKIISARHIAMYLSFRLTNESLISIAKAFNKKDHTTIINAIESIKNQKDVNNMNGLFINEVIEKVIGRLI